MPDWHGSSCFKNPGVGWGGKDIVKALFCAGVLALSVVLAPVALADNRVLLAVCMTLDDHPNISGVMGVLRGLMEQGYSAYDAGYALGQAAAQVCPEHGDLVMRFANAIDASENTLA